MYIYNFYLPHFKFWQLKLFKKIIAPCHISEDNLNLKKKNPVSPLDKYITYNNKKTINPKNG